MHQRNRRVRRWINVVSSLGNTKAPSRAWRPRDALLHASMVKMIGMALEVWEIMCVGSSAVGACYPFWKVVCLRTSAH